MAADYVFQPGDVEAISPDELPDEKVPDPLPGVPYFKVHFKTHYYGRCYVSAVPEDPETWLSADAWSDFIASALNERTRIIGYRAVFAELLQVGGLDLTVRS